MSSITAICNPVQCLFRALPIVFLLWLSTACMSGFVHMASVTAAITPSPEIDNVYPDKERALQQNELLPRNRRVLATYAEKTLSTSSTETSVLLRFREAVTDPDGILDSWNTTSNSNVCDWSGVACDVFNHVSTLDLSDHNLAGNISPLLGNLSFLSSLILAGNTFTGSVPSSLGRLQHLRHLDFSWNHLTSDIPREISNCSSLTYLDLSNNNLSGSVPWHLDNLENLSHISIHDNKLSASIPRELGNYSALQFLDLSATNLAGTIPNELGRLRRLSYLALSNNRLSGSIPNSISNCTSLTFLSLADNSLTGSIPHALGELRDLQYLKLYDTDLGGFIPAWLGNLTSLVGLELGCAPPLFELEDLTVSRFCPLTGVIPPELGRLRNLSSLQITATNITGIIPEELGHLSNLDELILHWNQLTGRIPPALGNLSSIEFFSLADNKLEGEIPSSLGRLGNLNFLTLRKNELTGTIPAEFGNLTKIWRLILSCNRLSGPVISELGKLSTVQDLLLENNQFSGELPAALGNCTALGRLFLQFNNISGSLPVGMFSGIPVLYYLDLTSNQLSGSIPNEIGNLKRLQLLNLSSNNLSGPVPSGIGNWYDVYFFDFSNNHLSGQLPIDALESLLHLENFTVANNDLEGPIPDRLGVFVKITADSYIGNPGLCGPLLDRDCSNQSRSESKCHRIGDACHRVKIYVGSGAAGIFLAALTIAALLLFCPKLRHKGPTYNTDGNNYDGAFRNVTSNMEDNVLKIVQRGSECKVTMEDLWTATGGFSELNVLGMGGQSTVYKAILPHGDGTTFAVKRMRANTRDADRISSIHGLDHELRLLRELKHRNLVKVHGYCTTHKVTALVMEFVPNGSLQSHLHPIGAGSQGQDLDHGIQTCELNLEIRIKIATGMADAMAYLHHECHEPIIHSDLKPSNILLDDEFNAKIADFGIARYVRKGRITQEATVSALYGTTGYIPPEYATLNRVSTRGDVYSFGVVLLELMTGKRPTDDTFAQDGTWLADWVLKAFPHRIADIVDNCLKTDFETIKDQIRLLIRVGLLCTREAASDRPSMQNIQRMLAEIKALSLSSPQQP